MNRIGELELAANGDGAALRRSPQLDGPGEEDGPWAEGWEQRCVAYRVLKES